MDKKDIIFIKTLEQTKTAFIRRIKEKFKKILLNTDFKQKVLEIRQLYKIPVNGFSLDDDQVQAVNDLETCNRVNSITKTGEEMEILDNVVELYINYFTDFREKNNTKKYFTNMELYLERAYLPEITRPEQVQWMKILKFYLFFNGMPANLLPTVGDLNISISPEVTKKEIKEYIKQLPTKRVRPTTTFERNFIIKETYERIKELKKQKKLKIVDDNSMVNYVIDYLPGDLKDKVNYETVRKVIYSGKIK